VPAVILTLAMAFTQADIDALKTLIATGAESITYGGPPEQSMTARSLEEMLQLLAMMEQEVNGNNGTNTTYRLAATKKGL
jgi:hypothetical protein